MILRLLCIWLVFYSLLSSLMHGTMNLKPIKHVLCHVSDCGVDVLSQFW
jgi:hypothetical protein